MNQPIIRLKDVSKSFDDTEVLKSLNLSIQKNEFLTLLGPSGCGKTTSLRIIGGFEKPTLGSVFFNGKDVTDLPPHKRAVNTIFQRYALFPHLNVFENIAFGLKIKRTPNNEIKTRVVQMLELVGLEGYDKRDISALSGGQQQRVAIARALINDPTVLLLDEPLGALDLKLRKDMQIELKKIQRSLGITFVYVTHDQEEALTMSDKIIVMNNGIIQQMGTPIDIYNEPGNAFVADFIGESNIIDGIMHDDFDVEFANKRFKCVDKGFSQKENIEVVIRPEDIQIRPYDEEKLNGVVTSVVFMGVHYDMRVLINDKEWMIHSTDMEPVGSKISISMDPDDIHIMHKSEGI